MAIKFYVAGSFRNKNSVNQIIETLEQKGLENTYNWTLNVKAEKEDDLRSIGQSEVEAVKNSDILIAILPGGKGTHIEIGIAIGNDKSVLLLSENEEVFKVDNAATFYFLENIYRKPLILDKVYSEVLAIKR